MEEINRISAQLDRASKNMSEQFDQVMDIFKGGEAARDNRLAISRSARAQNDDTKKLNRERVLKDPSLPLLPLVDIRTGKEIPSFPHDLKALNELDGKFDSNIFKPPYTDFSILGREMLRIIGALDVERLGIDDTSLRKTLRQAIM
ncbi:unnamed protein product [Clonostachys byssicola]|uniref:Uncharacterized protein n=1 Tax=Clonostachys byssicola TaxID=160290 RepID=A0A9N9XUM9_9HYPO|nr:unnamed protein product [Clonostachys byssicola]